MSTTLAITKITFLENIRQPVYVVLTLLGIALIVVSQYVTMFVLGQETNTIIETAFTAVLAIGLLISIFSSSNLLYYEFESKTMMTVLAKPVRREQIILGKYFGIVSAVLLSTLILAGSIALTARMSIQLYEDRAFDAALVSYLINMSLLTMFHLSIVIAVTILFSTTMPIALTAIFTFLVFLLGHFQDALRASVADHALLSFLGEIYGLIIPNFEFMNQAHLIYLSGQSIEAGYIGLNLIYSVIYTVVYLLLAMLLFERRDFS